MSVMLTEKAASEVKKIITEQKLEPTTFLRVGVAIPLGSIPRGIPRATQNAISMEWRLLSIKKAIYFWTAQPSISMMLSTSAVLRLSTPTLKRVVVAAVLFRPKWEPNQRLIL